MKLECFKELVKVCVNLKRDEKEEVYTFIHFINSISGS